MLGKVCVVRNAVRPGAEPIGLDLTPRLPLPIRIDMSPPPAVAVASGQDAGMGEAGLEQGDKRASNSGVSPEGGTQSGTVDPLAAFVTSLTDEQRLRLAELLTQKTPG